MDSKNNKSNGNKSIENQSKESNENQKNVSPNNENPTNENHTNENQTNENQTKEIQSNESQGNVSNATGNMNPSDSVTNLAVAATPTSIINASPTIPPVPSNTPKGYDNNNNSSKAYPIICTVSGVVFVCVVYLYIYLTRNKGYNKKPKNGINNNGNNNRFEIRVDKSSQPSNKNSSNFGSANLSTGNISSNNPGSSNYGNVSGETLTYNISDDRINTPYSDTNTLLEVNKNNLNFTNNAAQKKLFNQNKPRSPLENDISGETIPKNLNILTQEEVQLLKMKKNHHIPAYVDNDDSIINYASLRNENPITANEVLNERKHTRKRSSSTPDITAVAPFNFVNNNNNTNPDEIFNKESSTDYYDDSFIKKLGTDIKIETKKIEYDIAGDEAPINKLKIKRFNM